MRAHYLQHVPYETLGNILPWLQNSGFEISSTRFFENPLLPKPEDVDFLIILGGSMSANDVAEFPWLVEEKAFIRSCIRAGKPVLGICLGAQLMVNSMGARVYKNQDKEIGWFPIRGIPAAGASTLRFPTEMEAFHWHGETFDTPPGTVQLARSVGCENQAFQLGRAAIGLQFHLETTPELLREQVNACRSELIPDRYVQSEDEILNVPEAKFKALNSAMFRVLSFLRNTQP